MSSDADTFNKTQRRTLMSSRCDELWNAYKQWHIIEESKDIRAYACGGLWIHPCGESYQEAGRDGFEESSGSEHCDCDLCSEFRKEFCQ